MSLFTWLFQKNGKTIMEDDGATTAALVTVAGLAINPIITIAAIGGIVAGAGAWEVVKIGWKRRSNFMFWKFFCERKTLPEDKGAFDTAVVLLVVGGFLFFAFKNYPNLTCIGLVLIALLASMWGLWKLAYRTVNRKVIGAPPMPKPTVLPPPPTKQQIFQQMEKDLEEQLKLVEKLPVCDGEKKEIRERYRTRFLRKVDDLLG